MDVLQIIAIHVLNAFSLSVCVSLLRNDSAERSPRKSCSPRSQKTKPTMGLFRSNKNNENRNERCLENHTNIRQKIQVVGGGLLMPDIHHLPKLLALQK